MGCGGCGKARAAMAAKIAAQTQARDQHLAQLPADKKLTVMPHLPSKTPRQIRIEARGLRMARRAARIAARMASVKVLEVKQGKP